MPYFLTTKATAAAATRLADFTLYEQDRKHWTGRGTAEPFLSTLQNMGVKSLQGVKNFQQGEDLFVQAAYKFFYAEKMHFMQL